MLYCSVPLIQYCTIRVPYSTLLYGRLCTVMGCVRAVAGEWKLWDNAYSRKICFWGVANRAVPGGWCVG